MTITFRALVLRRVGIAVMLLLLFFVLATLLFLVAGSHVYLEADVVKQFPPLSQTMPWWMGGLVTMQVLSTWIIGLVVFACPGYSAARYAPRYKLLFAAAVGLVPIGIMALLFYARNSSPGLEPGRVVYIGGFDTDGPGPLSFYFFFACILGGLTSVFSHK